MKQPRSNLGRILLIEVGNTRCVLASYELQHHQCQNENSPIHEFSSFSTHPIQEGRELRFKLDSILEQARLSWNIFDAIVVSSVVPQMTHALKSILNDFSAHSGARSSIYFIDALWPFSFQNLCQPPEQVGVDRLINAEAVFQNYGCPALIVDAGTATTLCALSVDAAGKPVFLGGAIIPGIKTGMSSLADQAAQLFTVELSIPSRAIGRSTQEALQSGLILGHVSMLDGMIRRFKSEMREENLPVILSGGLSPLIHTLSTEITQHDPHLTLKGMVSLYGSLRSQQSDTDSKK